MTDTRHSAQLSGARRATDLADLLELEQVDRGLYRGTNADHHTPRRTLFGGQVAAQALRAAGSTVSGDRYPHSLHGYFLRPGDPDRPVLYRVDDDRDGRSFSARHVSALQQGEVIFSMLASFHCEEPAGTLDDAPRADVPPPDSVSEDGWDALTEMRPVTAMAADRGAASFTVWLRSRAKLGEDRLVHACALAYLSDIGSAYGPARVAHLPPGGPSIDHAVWFDAPLRADDWVLLSLVPAKASGGRGVYLGSMRDELGALGAFLTQEQLLRPR